MMKNVWAEGGRPAGLPPAGHGRPPRRQRKFDVYLKDVGSEGFYGYCAAGAPQARAPLGGLGLLRARRRLRRRQFRARRRKQPAGHRGARVLPRHPVRLRLRRGPLADGGHRHLDRGAGRRRRRRQPPVPRRTARSPAPRPARPLPTDRLRPAVRQLGVLRVPEQALRQRRYQEDLEQGRRLPGRTRQVLDAGDLLGAQAQGRVQEDLRPLRVGQPAAGQVLSRGPGLAEHGAQGRLHAHQEPAPHRQARPHAAAHVLGELADQVVLVAEEQEVVPQHQGRRTGVLQDAGGVRAGRQEARLRQAPRAAQQQGQRQDQGAVRPEQGEGGLRQPGERLDPLQVQQALRVLLLGPAHRRRPELQGPAPTSSAPRCSRSADPRSPPGRRAGR